MSILTLVTGGLYDFLRYQLDSKDESLNIRSNDEEIIRITSIRKEKKGLILGFRNRSHNNTRLSTSFLQTFINESRFHNPYTPVYIETARGSLIQVSQVTKNEKDEVFFGVDYHSTEILGFNFIDLDLKNRILKDGVSDD